MARAIDADELKRNIESFTGILNSASVFLIRQDAVLRAIELAPTIEAEPAQKWISVKDRLPTKKDANKNESVLAVAKKDGFGRSWCWDIVRDYSSEFSHWMPFPKFPWKEN